MMDFKLVVFFVGSYITVKVASYKTGGGEYSSVVIVCEGQRLHLKVNIADRTVYKSKITKDHGKTLLDCADEKCDIASRVTYNSPTAITLHDATVEDSGRYRMSIYFTDDTSDRILFKVYVEEGCPNASEFYSPAIHYRLGASPLELLHHTGFIEIDQPTSITISVAIPIANPQVNCTIRGRDFFPSRNGLISSRTNCEATFFDLFEADSSPTHTVDVSLMHPRMEQNFVKSIHIRTKDRPVEKKPTESPTTERAIKEGTQSSSSYQNTMDVIVLVVIHSGLWYAR